MVGVLYNAYKADTNSLLTDELRALVDLQTDFLQAMTGTVEKYLDQCGRRWVELSGLFSFMKV